MKKDKLDKIIRSSVNELMKNHVKKIPLLKRLTGKIESIWQIIQGRPLCYRFFFEEHVTVHQTKVLFDECCFTQKNFKRTEKRVNK